MYCSCRFEGVSPFPFSLNVECTPMIGQVGLGESGGVPPYAVLGKVEKWTPVKFKSGL